MVTMQIQQAFQREIKQASRDDLIRFAAILSNYHATFLLTTKRGSYENNALHFNMLWLLNIYVIGKYI